MSFPRLLGIVSILLFGGIFVISLLKEKKPKQSSLSLKSSSEVKLDDRVIQLVETEKREEKVSHLKAEEPVESSVVKSEDLPDADRIDELFNTGESQLPIVETISYTSRVPWIKGRPAWIADYAVHYKTPRYFISRSLSGERDYFAHNVVNGDHFNIFKQDKNFSFHLLVDLQRSKMWFYYFDEDLNERVLLKTYPVGLGQRNKKSASGFLTPLGTYLLGNKVAIYKPGIKGFFNHQKVEMIRVFGSRWIPFEKEIKSYTAPAKGLGLHGLPWIEDSHTGQLVENQDSIGKYESDGCIRLMMEDIEELYAIILTKPTYIHLVKDFFDAELPGEEKS